MYTVTVMTVVGSYFNSTPKSIEIQEFDNRNDAKKAVRATAKKYEMTRAADGTYWNNNKMIEISTNF